MTASNSRTRHKLANAKQVKFFAGVCLLINALTGPSIPFVPNLFQQSGWFPPIFLFCVFAVLATLAGLFIVEAMQAIPGNKHFQGTVEFATLVNFYFGAKAHYIAQFCLYGAIQSNAIQSIVLSAQAIDNILVSLFGKTCGISIFHGSYCVDNAVDVAASPFGDEMMFTTIGFIVVLVLAVPLGIMDLDSNVNLQVAWFGISVVIFGQWIVSAFLYTGEPAYQNNPVSLVTVGTGIENLSGTIMLSLAYTFVVPSWINLKTKETSVQSVLWWSSIGALLMYIIIGIIPALCYHPDPTTGGNILITLSKYGIPLGVTRASVYGFSIIMLLPSIPVSCIVSHDNLVQNNVCGKWFSLILAFVVPWIAAIPLQTGPILDEFQNWASLIFVSTANFIVPVFVYLQCEKFRKKYNQDRILSPKQLNLLKLIHVHSKPINQWVDYRRNRHSKAMSEYSFLEHQQEMKKRASQASSLASPADTHHNHHHHEETGDNDLTNDDAVNTIMMMDNVPNPIAEEDIASHDPHNTCFTNKDELINHMKKRQNESTKLTKPACQSLDENMLTPTVPKIAISKASNEDLSTWESRTNSSPTPSSPKQQQHQYRWSNNSKIEMAKSNTIQSTTSSVNFPHLIKHYGAHFHKTMTLPVEKTFVSTTFRSLPVWVTKYVPARVIAIGCSVLVSAVVVLSFAMMLQGIISPSEQF